MSSSDFRHIAIGTESGKSDRLFRAAVSAFCSLPRPSRREIAQLEDLALPLFDSVSAESMRFVAAALSECEHAPAGLVRKLCGQPVEIAAPLLIRSKALADADLVALIGRHGLPHARAIARRKGLNKAIADLIRVLEKPALVHVSEKAESTVVPLPEERQPPGTAAEKARDELRAMMHAQQQHQAPDNKALDIEATGIEATGINPAGASGTYARLRETALTGNATLFQTALADALGIDFTTARALAICPDYSPLLTALRALDLSEDKAFLIAVAAFPAHFPHPQAIRAFLDRYRQTTRDAARRKVRQWIAETAPNVRAS
ncbi:MAG: DUF2336 domain-containing protein [Mesorhizobium sp.]